MHDGIQSYVAVTANKGAQKSHPPGNNYGLRGFGDSNYFQTKLG